MQLTDKGLPTVIVSANLNLKGGRSGCRGFLDYARAHGPWRCLMLSEGRAGEQLLTLKRLGVSGVSAQSVSIYSYIDPILAVILSALLLSEPMTAYGTLGAVLILASTLVASIDFKDRKKRR